MYLNIRTSLLSCIFFIMDYFVYFPRIEKFCLSSLAISCFHDSDSLIVNHPIL